MNEPRSTPYATSDGPLLDDQTTPVILEDMRAVVEGWSPALVGVDDDEDEGESGDAAHMSLSVARGESEAVPGRPHYRVVVTGYPVSCPVHVVEDASGVPVRCFDDEGDARTWAARANDGARLLTGERPEDVGDEGHMDASPASPLTRQLLDSQLNYFAFRARMTGPGREPERAVHELFRRFAAWVIEHLDATESTDIPTMLDRTEASAWAEAGRIAQASRTAPRTKFYRALLGPLLTAETFLADPTPGSGGRYEIGVEERDESENQGGEPR